MTVFSMKGSMAVFMIAVGIKIISTGNTPIGTVRRSRLAVGVGMFCIFVTMLAAVASSNMLVSLVSYTLGAINMVGGLYIVRQMTLGKGLPHDMPIRFSVVSLSMILFGFNRIMPGVFGDDILFLSLILFSFAMTSVGLVILSITASSITEKREKDTKL